MLHEQGHDDHWILAPLTFVNGDGPGKREFGEIGVVIADGSLVGKLHHHLLLFQIDAGHRSQIAVKDFPLVVIDLLDHPITPGLQATYALLDANEAGHTIQFRRVDYDHEAVIKAIEAVRHPTPSFLIGFMRGERISSADPGFFQAGRRAKEHKEQERRNE